MKKRAFTLVELMVVLAIVALLSALIFGAISSVREGNKRGSCQGNLNAIYAAARLYAQDNDGQFPYLKSIANPASAPAGGSGLWALYVYAPQSISGSGDFYNLPLSSNDAKFPAPNDSDQRPAGTLASYLKSPRAFHCPSDNFEYTFSYNNKALSKTMLSGQIEFKGDDGRLHLNPYYLSYQVPDDFPNPDPNTTPTYSSFRRVDAKRQLRYFSTANGLENRRAPDQTIVTWCRFHRSLDAEGKTKPTDYSRTFDNVLFLDGSVQSVPVAQTVTLADGSASAVCRSWKRVPLAEANAVPQYVIDACNATP